MIPKTITDSDMIILHSVESYLASLNTPMSQNPQEKLMIHQQARDFLYSDIVRRVPRVAAYILQANMETDTIAQGLFVALAKHVLDPTFVNILMQYLAKQNNAEDNGITGALLAKIMNKHIEDKKKPTAPTTKKDKKEEVPTETDMSFIKHLQIAVEQLLGNIANIVRSRCGNLTQPEALAISACIAMNNDDTLSEIVASDLPVTAGIFDIIADPSNIIKAALLMDKSNFVKLTANQQNFVDSLKRWVYDKLNVIPTQTSYQFLVSVYGSIKPDTSKYLIQIKDCGTMYSNLLAVAKQICNG